MKRNFIIYIIIAWIVIFVTNGHASISSSDEDVRLRFFQAVLQQDQAKIDQLLTQKQVHIDDVDQYGRTALYIAATGSDLHFVHFLLNRGADINYQNSMGLTALSGAALGGNLEIFRYLVARGADPKVKDRLGGTSFTFAKHNDHQKIVDFLTTQYSETSTDFSDWDALYTAAYGGDLDIFQYLVEKAKTTSDEMNIGLGYLANILHDTQRQQPYQANIIKANMTDTQYKANAAPHVAQMFFISADDKITSEAYSTDLSLIEPITKADTLQLSQNLTTLTATENPSKTTITHNGQALMLGAQLWDHYIVEYIRYKTDP